MAKSKKGSSTQIVWTEDNISKTDFLVFREAVTERVTNVIAPNGFQVGLFDDRFESNLGLTGGIVTEKNMIIKKE